MRALLDVFDGSRPLADICAQFDVSEAACKLTLVNWGNDLPLLYSMMERVEQGAIHPDNAARALGVLPTTLFQIRKKYGYAPEPYAVKPAPLTKEEREVPRFRLAAQVLLGKYTALEARVLFSDLAVQERQEYAERLSEWAIENARADRVTKVLSTLEKKTQRVLEKEAERRERIVARRAAALAERQARLETLSGPAREAALAHLAKLEKERQIFSNLDSGISCSYRTVFRYIDRLSPLSIIDLSKWPKPFREAFVQERLDLKPWLKNDPPSIASPKGYSERLFEFAKNNALNLTAVRAHPKPPATWARQHVNKLLLGWLLGHATLDEIALSRNEERVHLETMLNGQLQAFGLTLREVQMMGVKQQNCLIVILLAMRDRKRTLLPEDPNERSPQLVAERKALVDKALRDAKLN